MDTQNKKLKLSGVEFFKRVREPAATKAIRMKDKPIKSIEY
jgi:hypothetical protein